MENEEGLKILFWIGTSFMVLLGLFLIILTLIYHKKVHLQKQKEAERLLNASLEVEKKERERIAKDFHDSVSGDLVALRNFTSILKDTEKDLSRKSLIEKIEVSVEDMLKNVQRINYNLMPPLLEKNGLMPVLESYFQKIETSSKIDINFSFSPISIPLSKTYELYRIIQELTTNIMKHNKVDIIYYSLHKKDSKIVLEVKDNGDAFDFFAFYKNSQGMGLKTIVSRVKQIEGELIQKQVKTGNHLVIQF